MMFNHLASVITAALVISGATTFAIPGPLPHVPQAREVDASPNVRVCTAGVDESCITIPVSANSCVNFDGGRAFLNKEVSAAVTPDGYVCTFYQKFGCLSSQGGADAVALQGGTWNFFSVPGTSGRRVNFNDLASSFICTPVA